MVLGVGIGEIRHQIDSRRGGPVLDGARHTVYIQYIQMLSGAGFVLSQTDGRPMYLQIIEQIRQRIAVGDWPAGELLPSIRQLATDLGVSVITVKRAYFELEREGVIVTQHGKGSVVANGAGVGARIHEQDLAKHLEQVVRIGALLGLTPKEIQSRLRDTLERFSAAVKERT
jgi:GntR family transcriptional regulator